MMIDKIQDRKKNLIVLAFVLAWLYLALVFPCTGDDFNRLAAWQEGLAGAWDSFAPSYFKLNGRLAGNFLSIFAIHRPLRVLAKTLSFLGLGWLLARTFDRKSAHVFLAFIIFFLPIEVFREVVVWNAGFYNYVPPLVLIALTFYLLRQEGGLGFKGIILVVSSFLSCLFMENLTIYALALPILVGLIYRDRPWPRHLASFLASLAGAWTMFSSPVYRRISQDQDGYRSVGLDNIMTSIHHNWPAFQDYLIPVALALAFVLILVYMVYRGRSRRASLVALAFLIGLVVEKELSISLNISLVLYIGFYLSLLLVSRGLAYGKEARLASLSMAVSMAPLLLVRPVGPRNFFTPALLNGVIIMALVYSLIEDPEARDLALGLMGLAIGIKLVFFIYGYTGNYQHYRKSLEKIDLASQEDAQELDLAGYPYPDLVHKEDWTKAANLYAEKYGLKDPVEINLD